MIGRALFTVSHALRGSRSPGMLRAIRAKPFGNPEAVRAEQLERLRSLLDHARRRVPYYRELLADLGLTADDFRSLGDLERLPVLTKDIVRERETDLVRDDVPLDSLSTHHSGGSTGVPLRFHRDRYYMDVSEAGTYRNFLQAGWRPGEMVAFFWGFDDRLEAMSRLEFEARQRVRRLYQFDPFDAGPEAMDEWLRTLRRIRPSIAHGYASTISRFAEHLERTGQEPPGLKGVFTTAEKLLPAQREVVGRVFRCKVYDCYGSSEVQNIAAECPGGRMHVMADFVILETEAPAAEEPAPLLVTSLQNLSMPFIRYRNEDFGVLLGDRCECGRGFPLMDLRIGRLSDNFRLPGGRVVHGEFFTHLMYGSDGIDRFQFHQKAVDEIELLVVPLAGRERAREQTIRSAIEKVQALDPAVNVEAREVEDIPLSSAGKHRFTRSDVDPEMG